MIMHKKWGLFLIPLLICVTLCVSMGPNLMNTYIKKDLFESKSYWTYNEPENVEITDAEFVQLFVNNGFEGGNKYSNGYNDADELELIAIKNQTKDVLYKVFGEDEAAFEKIESIIDSDMIFYDREILLTLIGSRTMSFVFVNLIYRNDYEQIEIIYEEKTSALCAFSYQTWEIEKVDWYFIDSIFLSAETYSQNVLGLKKNQYMTRCMVAEDVIVAYFSLEQTKEMEEGEIENSEESFYNEEMIFYN